MLYIFYSCYEYLPRFLNFTMVYNYNLFIFISVFLLPEVPENSGWTLYQCERYSSCFFFFFCFFFLLFFCFKSECIYSFYDILIVKRHWGHSLFYFILLQFSGILNSILYFCSREEYFSKKKKKKKKKNVVIFFYLFIYFTSTNDTSRTSYV